MRACWLLFAFVGVCHLSNGQDSLQVVETPDSTYFSQELSDTVEVDTLTKEKLVLVFAGDIMGHDTQIDGAYIDSSNSYNYEPTFRYIKDYIESADIAIGNLEVTLAGPPFKGYPQFSSPDALAAEAKKAGFDILVTANNHSADRGSKGIDRTIKVLDSLEIVHAGTFISEEDRMLRYPLIIEKKGVKIALLNYTYGTNGIVVKPPYIVNKIDTAQIARDIKKAKLASPDYIISVMHWGKEYERSENRKQQVLTRFQLDKGVDAVIGSHPHVVQPVTLEPCSLTDTNLKCPVFYSMGNFVSNQRSQYKDGGIMAELHISFEGDSVKFDSLAYMPYWVYRKKEAEEKYTFHVLPVAKYELNPELVNLNDNDLYRLNRFKRDTRAHLIGVQESDFYTNMKE